MIWLDDWQQYLKYRDEIESLLDPRLYTIKWLDEQIWLGAYQLFTNENAAIVTEVKGYPTGASEIHGIVAAGDLPAILELIKQAEKWGREQGCILASISSREGWTRVLKDYRVHQVYIVKELG